MGRPLKFDSDFREHAVELVRISSKPRSRIAAELGVSDTTLAKWMTQSRDTSPGGDDLTLPERQELEQLRKEKREWILEREILKKATAFWVKESNG